MKKKSTIVTILLFSCISLFAGDYVTNTNLSAAYLRNPSREAAIATDGVYYNPAGTAFLGDGFHLSFSAQSAFQKRNVRSTFAPLVNGVNNNGQDTKLYSGTATIPFVPSLFAVYNKDKWSVGFGIGVNSGGGRCEFEDGLGSFESVASMLPVMGKSLGIQGYDLDMYMKGRQYYFGAQFGATYKLTDNFSVYGGARVQYASCNYYGYIKNIGIKMADGNVYGASQYFGAAYNKLIGAAAAYPEQAATYQAQAAQMKLMADATEDVTLNCDQTGWGIAPIIGFDWKINDKWNVAMKYEFKTPMRLKNESANSQSAEKLSALDQFEDGKKNKEDVPAFLAAGVQYSPVKAWRLSTGFHYFFDKDAQRTGDVQKLLKHNTYELLAGAEWDATKLLTFSAGWMMSCYGNSDAYMKDMSFTTNVQNLGVGVQFHVSPKCSIDLGIFNSFYTSYDKTSQDYNGVSSVATMVAGQQASQALVNSGALSGKDHFFRKNIAFGVGLNLDF